MGKKGGFRSTLVLAAMIVVLSIAVGVALANFADRLPLLGPLFGGETRTTTSPVVVEGIQRLDELATVRWTESVVVTKETSDSSLEQFLTGERVVLVAAGEVEAGVNLAALGEDDVEVDGERVTIRLTSGCGRQASPTRPGMICRSGRRPPRWRLTRLFEFILILDSSCCSGRRVLLLDDNLYAA